MKGLENYFVKRAQKYNLSPVITHETMRMLANVLYGEKQEKLALEILITNTKNHPNSIGAHNSLARLYRRLQQIDNAKATYQKIIKLNYILLIENLKLVVILFYLKTLTLKFT